MKYSRTQVTPAYVYSMQTHLKITVNLTIGLKVQID